MRVVGTWVALKDCTVVITSATTLVRGPGEKLFDVGATLQLKRGQTISCVEFNIEVT
jgi:hypothetical protein